jgi:hypothetical protein
MSRDTARDWTATATLAALAAILLAAVAGLPVGLYWVLRDWAVTGQTLVLAAAVAAVAGIAVDLPWMASVAVRIYRYDRGPE